MIPDLASRAAMVIFALTFVLPAHAGSAPRASEAAYLAQNTAAMDRMMADMAIKPSGDVDRDFVHMMVPHHQGAINMALAVLRYGQNEKIRRLAQEIIVTQQQEIAAMRLAVGEPLPPSEPSPASQPSPDHSAMPSAIDLK
jgi:hypothetical protein